MDYALWCSDLETTNLVDNLSDFLDGRSAMRKASAYTDKMRPYIITRVGFQLTIPELRGTPNNRMQLLAIAHSV
jgi:hypothetical protein